MSIFAVSAAPADALATLGVSLSASSNATSFRLWDWDWEGLTICIYKYISNLMKIMTKINVTIWLDQAIMS